MKEIILRQILMPSDATDEYNRCKRIVFDEIRDAVSIEERQALKRVMERIVIGFMEGEE